MSSNWSSGDERWLGDYKVIAREMHAQMARVDEHAEHIAKIFGVHRNSIYRRFKGNPQWRRWELEKLAEHWGIELSDLTGENSQNSTHISADP